LFTFSGKKAPNLVDFLDLFSVTGHQRNRNFLRCAFKNRSMSRVVRGKWLWKD